MAKKRKKRKKTEETVLDRIISLGGPKSDRVKRDLARDAKPPGKRKAGKRAKKKYYYERRVNRSDLKNRKI